MKGAKIALRMPMKMNRFCRLFQSLVQQSPPPLHIAPTHSSICRSLCLSLS